MEEDRGFAGQDIVQEQASSETVQEISQPKAVPAKTAADWVRDMRMSADVNGTTVGVEDDRVTPRLLLATSQKLLKLNRREVEPDAKDSLQFQRIYGPADFVAEHVLKDANRVGRQLLWKATNKGSVDFMPTSALDQHVSDVFNASKMANMIDGSSPLETVEASYKVTRLGEGGVGSIDSAPVEMRLVQPSFLGYLDAVATPECTSAAHLVLTARGWRPIAEVTEEDLVACMVDGNPVFRHPEQVVSYPYSGTLCAYNDDTLAYELTPNHRAWCSEDGAAFGFTAVSSMDHGRCFFRTDRDCTGSPYRLDASKFIDMPYTGRVYCLTVSGGMFYTKIDGYSPFWTGNSLRVGLDGTFTKHCMKGSDGKLYQKFINAHTGKEELVDSVTAAKSVVTTADMMQSGTDHIYAVGGRTGVRIVKKSDVDYYLPRMDDAFSNASNMVTGLSGVKELRLRMGCLHPDTCMLAVNAKREVCMMPAKDLCEASGLVPSAAEDGAASFIPVRGTYSKFPGGRAWFKKVVLLSGRTLITSKDHRWWVLRGESSMLVAAEALKPGDKVMRSVFKDVPSRRTFINARPLDASAAVLIGCAVRTLESHEGGRLSISWQPRHDEAVRSAVERLGIDAKMHERSLSVQSGWFHAWLLEQVGARPQDRRIPSCILSAELRLAAAFLDAYTADPVKTAEDGAGYVWVLDIPCPAVRDGLAFLLARTGTDTLYRDSCQGGGEFQLALKLVPFGAMRGDCLLDEVKAVLPAPNAAVMVDVDADDRLYATASGIVTHNSKYPQQAVSIEGREPPLVRGLDERSGTDFQSRIGKYLGALYADKPGTVTAVRKDRVDMLYDDGTKGSVALYVNFPMNAKGFINSTPQVKAGQHLDKGGLLASSNYTDDKGVAALGTNLRIGWISWHGGTYEDAIVLSESAAKKMSSTTMYSKDLDLDGTVQLGKRNYLSWKPGEYSSEQLAALDDEGVVKPGTVLHKGDPVVLAVRTTEPSPGTMGKRVLTDLSETWDHDHPGTVTDIVRTRSGVKVLATVTAGVEVGDKLANCFDDRTEVFTRRGFVPFSWLGDDDEVAVLHPDGTASFEQPAARQVRWRIGPMVEYRTRHASFCVTPDHMIAAATFQDYWYGDRRLTRMPAADAFGRTLYLRTAADFSDALPPYVQEFIELPQAGPEPGSRYASDDPRVLNRSFDSIDLSAFIGIYLAEGHCAKPGKGYWMRIYQYDNVPGGADRCHRIEELLDRLGVAWHYYGHQYFMLDNYALYGLVSGMDGGTGKRIPEEAFTSWSAERLRTLLEWLCMNGVENTGDGDELRTSTTSIELADGIQRAWLLLGRSCSLHGRTVHVTPRQLAGVSNHGFVSTSRQGWRIVPDYHGYVYCVTTSTGVILVRRDGIASWNGQCYGNKGVVSQVLPDDSMPKDKDGKPLDIIMSPLGLVSRTNASQLDEAMLGKVAKAAGKFETIPAFYNGDRHQYVLDKLRQHHLKPDDDFYDPDSGRKIPDVVNGYAYIYKLKHMSESKESGRGTGEYSADETPGGSGYEGSKRFGSLEQSAMAAHSAFENLLDSKLIRGQENSEFWRSVRTGGIPVIPGEPLVQRKFFAHLKGSGVNVRKTAQGISVFALGNSDVRELAGPRELKSGDTYEARTFRPMDGGLFGQDVFGMDGDRWGYIQLDEPVPSPVMADPLARLLRMSAKDFTAVASGAREVDGMKNGADLKARLASIDLNAESKKALQEFKDAIPSRRDGALKRYVAVERMRRLGRPADEYMLDRIPVLPPVFRPVSSHNGMTMVADANYLYKQLIDARDDFRESKDLPQEYQDKARANIYNKWQELTGMYDPEDVKLRNKNVGGLLQWALGKGSPKFSAVQRKVIGTSVDTVGRGAVVPDSKLNIDQVGLPVSMALSTMAPFVTRALVQRGYTTLDAMKMVKRQAPQALDVLNEVMKTHPVQMNRAPTLHRFNIMAFKPVLVSGHALHVHPSICPGMAMDFDGDSIENLCRLYIKYETLNEKIQKSGLDSLTSLEYGVYSSCCAGTGPAEAAEQGEAEMIGKDVKCMFATATGALSELPVVEGSEVRKSDTVTEWDVQDGFYTDTVDPATGRRAFARIEKVSRHTGLKMFDCTLSTRGSYKHVVTASEDHSLIALDPETLQLGKTRPQDAAGLFVPRTVCNAGNSRQVCAKYISIDKQYAATHDLGFLIGAILGDGWVDANDTLRIACCDQSLGEYLMGMLKAGHAPVGLKKDSAWFSYNYSDGRSDRFSDKDARRLTVYTERKFNQALRSLIGSGAENKRIPEDCMMASKSHLAGILMGLLATDGSITYSEGTQAKRTCCKTVTLNTTSPYLRDGLQELCLRLGIRSSATPYMGVNSKRTCYGVCLSLRDLAAAVKADPAMFRIHHDTKQTALDKIILEVEKSDDTRNSTDVVPFPESLRCEFLRAGARDLFGTALSKMLSTGCIDRGLAGKLADLLRGMDWSLYSDAGMSVPAAMKRGHSPEQASELVSRWIAMVEDTGVMWERVDAVAESTCTEGWDCTVPGPYTFTLSTGTVVQDTVNIHVPVSDNARKEALDRMLPSRNLIGPADRKIMNKPEKEYMQGLYIATRMGQAPGGKAPVFRTLQEAKEAQRRGDIEVDTPVDILELGRK